MDKYEIIDDHCVIDFLRRGYEIVHSYTTWSNTSQYLNGNFMGNDITINNFPTAIGYTKFIMKRTPQAEVLYGEKNDDN